MKIIQLHNSSYSQMMGYLLVTEHGNVIAVDGGTRFDAPEFCRVVKSLGGHINLWCITHPHYDHYGVLAELTDHPDPDIQADLILYSSAPEQYAIPEWELEKNLLEWSEVRKFCPYPMQEVFQGNHFLIDHVEINILRAANPDHLSGSINHLSIVFMLTEKISPEKNFKMIFLGDLDSPGGEELLQNYAFSPDLLKADAVQMAHHGQNGVDLPVYQAISPRYTFWPTPDWLWTNSRNGKPGPWKTLEVRGWMEDMHAYAVTSLTENAVFDTQKCQLD